MHNTLFASTFLSLLILSGCIDTSVGTPPEEPLTASDLQEVLEQAVDNSVLPAVRNFTTEATALDEAAENFCQLKNASALNAMQQQWRLLLERWYQLAIYNFGPLDDDIIFPPFTFIDSLRLRGTNYTETVRSEISSDLASSADLNLSAGWPAGPGVSDF